MRRGGAKSSCRAPLLQRRFDEYWGGHVGGSNFIKSASAATPSSAAIGWRSALPEVSARYGDSASKLGLQGTIFGWCDTPGGEPVDLVVEKPVQEIEAPRVAGGAVELETKSDE